jgi:hypothetical protein
MEPINTICGKKLGEILRAGGTHSYHFALMSPEISRDEPDYVRLKIKEEGTKYLFSKWMNDYWPRDHTS